MCWFPHFSWPPRPFLPLIEPVNCYHFLMVWSPQLEWDFRDPQWSLQGEDCVYASSSLPEYFLKHQEAQRPFLLLLLMLGHFSAIFGWYFLLLDTLLLCLVGPFTIQRCPSQPQALPASSAQHRVVWRSLVNVLSLVLVSHKSKHRSPQVELCLSLAQEHIKQLSCFLFCVVFFFSLGGFNKFSFLFIAFINEENEWN